jgi:hypothetical protein
MGYGPVPPDLIRGPDRTNGAANLPSKRPAFYTPSVAATFPEKGDSPAARKPPQLSNEQVIFDRMAHVTLAWMSTAEPMHLATPRSVLGGERARSNVRHTKAKGWRLKRVHV